MNGKNKGSSFERKICSELSLWWTNGERDDVFWRTASSGGRATCRSKIGKKTKNHHGDVMAVDPVGQPLLDMFVLELKKGYNKDTLFDIFDKSKKMKDQVYEKWIRQAKRECKESGSKSWMIIHQRDRRDAYVTTPYFKLFEDLADFRCAFPDVCGLPLSMLKQISPMKIKGLLSC